MRAPGTCGMPARIVLRSSFTSSSLRSSRDILRTEWASFSSKTLYTVLIRNFSRFASRYFSMTLTAFSASDL